MATGLADQTAQISTYVHKRIKARIVDLTKVNHRMTISRVAEEAIEAGLPLVEKRYLPHSDSPKSQRG